MQLVPASSEQLEELRASAAAFESFVRGAATAAVLRRYAWWSELRSEGRALGIDVAAQDDADRQAVAFAQVVRGLDHAELELVGWQGERGALTLGVVRRGTVPGALGLWPLVSVVVVGAVLTAAWVLVDAWLSARTIEAKSDALRAQAQAQATAAIAAAPDADAADKLARALERANRAAAGVQPSLLDKLAGYAASATDVVGGGLGGGGLLILFGLWYWSQRKRVA